MRERILAVVGAIGLIVGAFFLRSVIAGGDDSAADGPNRANGQQGNSGAPVVACEPDLQAVCDALVDDGVITRAPVLALSGAASGDLTVDGWITWDPAPGVANFDRPGTWADTEALASAPLGVLVNDGPGECGETSTWMACVIASAEQGVPVGVGTGTTAQSLARIHPIAAALVPDGGDFTRVSGAALEQVITSPQIPQADYVRQISTFLTRRGALGLVVGPLPVVEAAVARQASATVSAPTPTAEITVVITSRQSATGSDAINAESLLRSSSAEAALVDLGLTSGAGTVADTDRAGEVYAIREKVS